MKNCNVLYEAVLTRDARFDGKFFTGVKTTGVYCRPICPAQPKRENMIFFENALQAENAGYRPCLRCCPESAPFSPVWMGKNAIVNKALKYIEQGIYNQCQEDGFARNFGVTARHLRRLFQEEIGMTPKQINDCRRLNFARKLLVETNISITEIAMNSGFCSIRSFNHAIKKKFARPPRDIRKNKKLQKNTNIKLFLSYRPPYRWEQLLQFYRSHYVEEIASTTENSYSRVFKIDGIVGSFCLYPAKNKPGLILEITNNATGILLLIVQKIRQMFDLDSDPMLIKETFSSCNIMSKIYKKYYGLRLPGCWNPFETSICIILSQLVSTKQACSLIRQITKSYGTKITHPITGQDNYFFPDTQVLSNVNLNNVQTTQKRKETIKNFSRSIIENKIHLSCAQNPEIFKNTLMKVKGIGEWTAQCISLRVLSDTDAFPKTDLVLKRILQEYSRINVQALSPWKSYAAICLWNIHSQQKGQKK